MKKEKKSERVREDKRSPGASLSLVAVQPNYMYLHCAPLILVPNCTLDTTHAYLQFHAPLTI